jgi:membrane AbrB-like protein
LKQKSRPSKSKKKFSKQLFFRQIFTLIWATICGMGAQEIGLPLPWVLGPMFGVGFLSMTGVAGRQPIILRNVGLVSLGLALGLYFSPSVLTELTQMAGWMVLGAIVSLCVGILFARFMQRFARVDGYTAVYSSAIGAAGDMAIQAQKVGADGASVATSHAIRLMMVVTVIPFIATLWGVDTQDLALRVKAQLPLIDPMHLAVMAAIALALPIFAAKTKFPNPWVLIPMICAGVYAGTGNEARLPDPLVNAGTLLLGWNLGQHLSKEFFRSSPRVMAGAALMTVGMLLISFAFAAFLYFVVDMPPLTAMVAASPGGIVEMAITAKVLGLGAAVVTAFQLVRLVSVIVLVKPIADFLVRSGWVGLSSPVSEKQ